MPEIFWIICFAFFYDESRWKAICSKSTHYITFRITNPSGKNATDSEANCNNRKKIENTSAGDYRIEVAECAKADEWRGSFKIKFSVR